MFLFKQKEGDNIFLKERGLKDISKLYNIVDVVDGDIITNKGKINIYEITPCTVIGNSIEIKRSIFNAYLIALKMVTFDFQIIVNTNRMNFNTILNVLNKNMYATDNMRQKRMIEEYKEYLFDLSKEVQLFTKTFYLVTNKLKLQEENQLKEAFSTMKHLGITITKITDEKRIYNILYEGINKLTGGADTNEY